jgi:hypothetical protein
MSVSISKHLYPDDAQTANFQYPYIIMDFVHIEILRETFDTDFDVVSENSAFIDINIRVNVEQGSKTYHLKYDELSQSSVKP